MIARKMKLVLFVSSMIFVTSCATKQKTVALGGGIGATGGAALGAIADPGKNGEYRTRNIVVGAALGGMAGLITGSVVGDKMDKARKESFEQGRKAQPSPGEMPKIKDAVVETQWVPAKRVGNRFIEGHFEYLIAEPARWEDGQ